MMAVTGLLILAVFLMLSGCAKMTEEERAQKASPEGAGALHLGTFSL